MDRREGPSKPAIAPAPAPVPPRERQAHVLVVDDAVEVREFLEAALRASGFRVSLAGGGDEALRTCRSEPPQVVLTDLSMAPMNGRDLVEALRRECPTAVPVVLTGYGTVEGAVELIRLGAFEVLSKPCHPNEVTAVVTRALEHHEALRANEELRERLRVQEKLAMIGKLAAGVAHELNNPLDAVLRSVRLVRGRGDADEEVAELLDMAETGLLRMADIVKGLLTFSRQAAVEQAPQSLESLVREAVSGVTLALGERAPEIRVDVRDDASHTPVPRAIHQVLTNLLRNACDAAGPVLPVTVRATREADRLVVCVEDRGPGIPPEVLPRIFEPFFTTKEPGKGTGLGLPISARLVEKFGGNLRIECPATGGTVAVVSLPVPRLVPQPV
jgi:signal transduction histidine kinase